MIIRYFNTLYNKEDSYVVTNGADITFKDGKACFCWFGSRLAIDIKDIISIERI